METADQAWTVRAPWPDEAERLARNFKVNALDASASMREAARWVIVAEAPERIVGQAVLQEVAMSTKTGAVMERGLRLACNISLAWRTHAAAEALLEAALAHARELEVDFVEMTVSAVALAEMAKCKGFEEVSRQEVWSIPVGEMLGLLEKRGGRMLERVPVAVAPLGRANLERVRKICATASLLTPERVRLNRPGVSMGFDGGLSFFTGEPGDPSAVLLAREYLGSAYLEALANNAQAIDLPATTVIALLRAFFRAVAELGLDNVTCAVRAGTNPGMMRLARRCGAVVSESMMTMRVELSP